jgi:ribose transport system substrate-binding protein
LVGGAALSLLNACGGAQATPTPAPAATPTRAPAPSPTAAAAASPTAAATTPAADATPTAAAAAGPVPTVAPGTKITIAMVPKLVHPFFEDCRKGSEQKAKELGVTFEYVAPQQADPALQVKIIEDLIRKKVHAISISPNEPKSVEPVIAEGMKQGIHMMTFDADSPNSQRVMYIGTDNKAAGKTMGETMAKLLNGRGKVGIITGGLGALNLNQRIEGFKEGVGPNIQVVDVQATDDDLQKGLSVSEAMLRAHPDLNGIACVSATGGPTLAQVLKSPEFQDRIGKLVIVAFDDLEETKRAIQEGIIAATMVQRPVQMGVLTVQWAYDILTGKAKPPFKNIDTGVTVVTKENLNSYTK